jgi:lipoprotein-anchoring transpeptidase ErfK/SrfK
MRALPLNPDALTEVRVAAYQVALERMNFSCGFIDGDVGMRTQRALRSFQQSRGLPITGALDLATQAAVGEPGEPFFNYTVTAEDMALIVPTPKSWREKSRAQFLGYNEAWEMLAEKFHCTKDYIRALNADVAEVSAGTLVIGPKVFPEVPLPKAAFLRIVLGETSLQGVDADGRIVAHFPCSIAADKNKRPSGQLTVINFAPDPNYTFKPEVLEEAARAENITRRMIIPPGPNNPVGRVWIGLSLPGYGIHGTPEPEDISRTQSHGCFRLSNWNAQKVYRMIKTGTPVEVIP